MIIYEKEMVRVKKTWMIVWILSSIFLTGCQTSQPPQISESAYNTANLVKTETAAECGCLEPISLDVLSQNVYDDLQYEWDSWNSLSQEEKMLSSHMPGCCQRSFDDWAECENFLGLSIPNPLEECSWLEKATYVAMPIGFRDAPRVKASWYGTENGHVEWVSVETGYRNGQVRVMIGVALYGDPVDIKPSDSGWLVELERQNYLANMGSSPLQVVSDSTEKYFSNVAYQAHDNMLYRFNIVGEPSAQAEVEDTLEQVVNSFPSETNS